MFYISLTVHDIDLLVIIKLKFKPNLSCHIVVCLGGLFWANMSKRPSGLARLCTLYFRGKLWNIVWLAVWRYHVKHYNCDHAVIRSPLTRESSLTCPGGNFTLYIITSQSILIKKSPRRTFLIGFTDRININFSVCQSHTWFKYVRPFCWITPFRNGYILLSLNQGRKWSGYLNIYPG